MKRYLLICIFIAFNISLLSQYSYEYDEADVTTPTGVSVDAFKFDEDNYDDFDGPAIAYWNWWWTNGYNCRILANSTKYYNCHGYAWHNIEGRMSQSDLRWINEYDGENPTYNVTKYFSDATKSYTETATVTNHLRVTYFPSDHSAVTTEHQDSVISKFGWGPLVKHTLNQCPFYDGAQIKYYKLWPEINGTFTALCYNSERTFGANMSIPGSTYTWTRDNSLLDYVSGAGTTSYRVKAKNNSGDAWIQFQMTSPSGEVATRNEWVWVNKPVFNSIEGQTAGYTGMTYYYIANPPYEQRALSTYSWILEPLNSNYVDDYPTGYAYITFYDPDYYILNGKADNICGSSGWRGLNIYIYQGYRFSISPNPASEEVSIKVTTSSNVQDTEIPYFDINIIDLNGIQYNTYKRSGFEFTFPVSNLRNGTYLVNIKYGKKIESIPLIIKH